MKRMTKDERQTTIWQDSISLIVTCIVLFFSSTSPVVAQTPQEQLSYGNAAYAQGHYEEAIRHYEAILDAGFASSTLHYNLGNAYVKAGKKGLGIVHYERALRLDPLDVQTHQNLEWVRRQIQDKIVPKGVSWFSGHIERFLELWRLERVLRAAAAANHLFFALLIAALFLKAARKRLKPLIWIVGIIFILTLILIGIQGARTHIKEGVVLASEVQVRFSPSEQGQAAFTLHEGTKCKIRSRVPGWIRIRLADGKAGWLEESAVEEI